MSIAKFSPIFVFKNKRNPLIVGDAVKILCCVKILKDFVLLLIGVAVYFMYHHRSLKKRSCCFAFLNSVILQILQCCLSKQLCQLSSLLH